MSEYKYDAFISYRHLPVDMAVAKRLVELLERVDGPDGEKMRVFRDRDELPTEEDLGNAIRNALEDSAYLVVVCSPEYSRSKWCMEELRYFRSLHGNSNARIIPILVEGEPEESFPDLLRWVEKVSLDEEGRAHTLRVEVEPLSADVRADSPGKRMRLLRTEYLRIVARILKKPFDELYNRARRRRIRIYAALAGLLIAGLLAFSGYNMNMLSRIEKEHMNMLANESLRLSVESQERLAEGDSRLAMLLALQALPQDLKDPERPLTSEAEVALRSAVYSQMYSRQAESMEKTATVMFDTQDWQLTRILDGGQKFAVSDKEWLYIYDAANGMCLFRYPSNFYATAELNRDGSLLARTIPEGESEGFRLYRCEVYSVAEDRLLFSETLKTPKYSIMAVWDLEENLCVFYDDENALLTVDSSGEPNRNPEITPEQAAGIADTYYDLRYYQINDYYDYDAKNGPLTALGEKYQETIQNATWTDSYRAAVTPDERYLIMDANLLSVYDMTQNMKQCLAVSLDGTLIVDSGNLRLYQVTDYALNVYTLRPENKSSDILDLLGMDGSRGLRFRSANSGEEDEQLWICSTDDLDTPLLDLTLKNDGPYERYYLTPDLDYAFIETPEGQFQLWHVDRGLVAEPDIPAETAAQTSVLSVSADGSLLAVAQKESRKAAVYSGLDGSLLQTIDLTDLGKPEDFDHNGIYYLEFEGTDLLISLPSESWIVDTTGENPTVQIMDGIYEETGLYRVDGALTGDGLLFCMGEWFTGAVDAIYDIHTGNCVFRNVSYVQYHEPSGILLFTPSNPQFGTASAVHAARRDEQGNFAELYSVPLEDIWGRWDTFDCLGTKLFMLRSMDGCSLYEIETGKHLMTMYPTGDGRYPNDSLSIIGDTIYDRYVIRDGSIYTIPLLDTAELMEQAHVFLDSPLGQRYLTDLEKAEYFID